MPVLEWTVCDTKFLDVDLLWNTDQPKLTPCFQQSVLALIPCAIMILMCFLQMFIKCVTTKKKIIEKHSSPCTLMYTSKQIANVLLIAITLLELVYFIYRINTIGTRIPLIVLISIIGRLAGFFLAVLLQVRQRQHGDYSSSVLFTFWVLSFICGFFYSPLFDIIIDNITETTDSVIFVLNMSSFALVCVQALFQCFTDPDYGHLWKGKTDEFVIQHQSVPSRLLFSYLNRMMFHGYKNEIKITDIDPLSPDMQSINIHEELNDKWSIELDKAKKRPAKKPSLNWALAKTLWPLMLAAAILELIFDFVILLPPLLLDALINFTEDKSIPQWHGIVFALSLFCTNIVSCLLSQHNVNYTIYASIIPRTGLTAAIYRKSLRLSSSARSRYTVGELCNLIAVDTQELFQFMFSANLLWSSPLRIILTITLLWQYLGWACLVGAAVMICSLPITAVLATKTHKLQRKQMENKDWRLRQMGDILNGIKILKLFAWEKAFLKRISDVRTKEIHRIKKMALINSSITFLWTTMAFMVAITSFVTFVLTDEANILDASVAFVSLTLFNQLRVALSVIPDVITDFIQSKISSRRIEDYLLSEELREDVRRDVNKGESIVLDHCSFSWSTGEEPFLCNISARVPEGKLVAVVGQVGSGKSALLSAILGEMHKVKGEIFVQEGDIAYVSQQAWIQNATLQENILFTNSMNNISYNDTIERCCLSEDLKILPARDQTEIGEKGVNLSGGQKQRISLARAVYHNANIYLLDDPLSAVDAHVGTHIFNKVIGPNGVLRNKTRVLVTHNLSILPEMDLILVMSNGKVEEIGSYKQLMEKKGEFAKFVEDHQKKAQEEEMNDMNETDEQALENGDGISRNEPKVLLTTAELKEQMKRRGSRISRTMSVQDPLPQSNKKKTLVEDEKVEMGKVKGSVFLIYFRYATFCLISSMIAAYIIFQGFEVGSNFWLSAWSNDPLMPDGSTNVPLRNLRIIVYGILGIGQGLSILIASFLLAFASTRASKALHNQMMYSILRSPMIFFDSTPSGRILNRFGKDINVVDSNVPYAMNKLLSCMVSVFATLIVISINSTIFIAVILVLGVFYFLIQSYYLNTSRQVRRLQSTTLSPVMSNFSETVQGASVIRAYRAQRFFVDKEDDLVDINVRSFFCSTQLNRWLPIRLELIGSILVLSVAFLTVFSRDALTSGIAGLTLTYALNMTSVLSTLVKFHVNVEIRMVSVERIAEYSELLSEASWESPCGLLLPKSWPAKGAVTFENFKMRYQKDLNLVLKGLNLDIRAGEKVGIVGRTGAGKSSVALALFRIVEPADGAITIDGVDIAQLGLHELRSQLTIIPQDPVLFDGTIRFNLDPLVQFSDDKLWEALEHSHLKPFVTSLDKGLEFNLTAGGENLSVGQRQQLCLARALLKKTRVLVLDEATAAVDMETDRLIQSTIRREFDESTVITIAHRLYTILDYDRIIVMDNGYIVEEGAPDNLLQNTNSYFFKLSKDAGLV